MVAKLGSILLLLIVLTGCTIPPKLVYHSKVVYYKPNGEVFKEYTFKSELKPRLEAAWDGRQYVYLGAIPLEDLPAAPQGWMITLETEREQ